MKKRYVVAAVVVAVIAAGLFLPALFSARESGGHSWRRCKRNLRQIGMACQIYAADYENDFPPTLSVLSPLYLDVLDLQEWKVLSCPSAGRPGEIGYDYIPGLRADDPPDCVLACDKKGNHEGGRFLLFVAGNVEWMTEEEFQKELRKTLQYLEEKNHAPAEDGG